jgi:DNA-binding XRE family transcriptional regulator
MTAMEKSKRKRLEKTGWRVGTAGEFLGLSKAEEALVDMKLVLGTRLRKTREQHQMTQTDLAKRIGSSQSRVAKMEAGDQLATSEPVVLHHGRERGRRG